MSRRSALRRSAVLALVPASSLLVSGLAFAADIDAAKPAVAATGAFRPLVTADRTSTPLLAPDSSEGTNRIRQFKLAPGLKVDLWAAEPMLANPVAFSIDGKGRVFTSETYRYRSSVLDIRHYMFMLEDDLASRNITNRLEMIRKWFGPEGEKALSAETEVIRQIEDTDHDGKADTSTVFADGFNSPLSGIGSGVLARNGEVWFTEIPSLWRMRTEAGTELKGSKVEELKGAGAAVSASSTVQPFNSSTNLPLASIPHVAPGHQAEELLRGFGVRFSYTGHDLHGLTFGPDGRLYFSVGDRAAHVVTRERTVIDLPDEGAVFRCEPDGSRLEVVHRGLRNPQELAFNEFGDLFTGDNDSDQGDRERWVQVVEGADSGWRVGHQHAPLGNAGMWNLERLWVPHFQGQAASLFPPIANIGDGPSGLVYTGGVPLGANPEGRFLLAYFKGTSAKSGVSSIAVRQRGAGYEMTAHDEFLWNSLVPDVDLAPDGSIFFADWHEGWPKSNKGRLYRAYFPEVAADPGMRETARLLGEGFTGRPESELRTLLAHRDLRVRQEAQFALAARGTDALPGLRAATAQPGPTAIHALRAIGQIGRKSPALAGPPLLELAGKAAGEEQVQAIRALGSTDALARQPGVRQFLLGHLKEGSPRVQSAAALALAHANPGRMEASNLVEVIRQSEDRDPVLRHSRVHALSVAASESFLQNFASDADPSVRVAALLAARRQGSAVVTAFLADPDPLLVLEAARAINDVPITNALPALAALAEPETLTSLLRQFASRPAEDSKRETPDLSGAITDIRADQPLPWTNAPVDFRTPLLLRIVNANFRLGTEESAGHLASLAANTDLPALIRTEALFALGTWATPPARDRIVGVFRPLPARDAAPARDALAAVVKNIAATDRYAEAISIALSDAVTRLAMTGTLPLLSGIVRDPELTASLAKPGSVSAEIPPRARAAALRAFTRLETRKPEIDALLAYAAKDSAEIVRLEASKRNAELNPNDAAGQLHAKLESGSVAEQQAAYTSLGDLKSDTADAMIADALERLMKRELPNEVMLDLVEAARKRGSPAVKSRLAAYQDWKLPKDHLSPYREALSGGDAGRGRKLFYEHAAVACTRCHQIGTDAGGNAGPKLDGIASRATTEHLLESLVFPNRQIAQGFESSMITTRAGGVHAGVVRSEDATSLVIATPDEGEVRLLKSEVKTRERGVSGMPEGFGELLTRFELRDVIEFLGTLK